MLNKTYKKENASLIKLALKKTERAGRLSD
jgi:hypothetical protein